ncbi:hypothetical protein ACFOWX_06455 [Sphingorhabdus arenilitoris]|uniref:DUF2846 domain-containing protein n=1 Tax=Sphingorhabdus arenilitoris TaxID=1490041 RepID=A0ABV8RF77_9SPHN
MKMTNKNVIFFGLALLVGIYLGLQYPLFGMVLLIPLIIFVVVILMRNKSGELADAASTEEARNFQVRPGLSRIYVMRDGFVGGQQGMNITIDGAMNSQIRSKYFLMLDVEPGKHQVTAQMASGTKSAELVYDVETADGECVLLDAKLNVGLLQGTPTFDEIRKPHIAKDKLAKLKLVKWKT